MKFLMPILQGVIILMVVAVIGWGFSAYGQLQRYDERISSIERDLKSIADRLEKLPLCRN